jgi:hypothetical protein
VDPKLVNEQLMKASEILFGAEGEGETSRGSGSGLRTVISKENLFDKTGVQVFEDLGLSKQEYIFWLTNPEAREMLLSFSKKAYNNENVEFVIAGEQY